MLHVGDSNIKISRLLCCGCTCSKDQISIQPILIKRVSLFDYVKIHIHGELLHFRSRRVPLFVISMPCRKLGDCHNSVHAIYTISSVGDLQVISMLQFMQQNSIHCQASNHNARLLIQVSIASQQLLLTVPLLAMTPVVP
jgi:hypothetical protein